MASTSSSAKNKRPLIDPALCRCCRSIKKCRLLNEEYEWQDSKETYSDMIMDCFGLLLCQLDGDERDRCICATCVVRLRDACAFRRQVLTCEEAFIHAKLEKDDEQKTEIELQIKAEPVTLNDVNNIDVDSEMDHVNDDTDVCLDQNLKTEPSETLISENSKTKVKLKGKKNGKTKKKVPKKDLLNKMHKLKEKLDLMLDDPCDVTLEPPKELHIENTEKRKEELDHDRMVYENAIVIVHNSYVCPFRNRISNYYCFYCRDQFTNPVELREHTLTHDPKSMFESTIENKKVPKIDVTRIDCRLCNEKIDDLQKFKQHITNIHDVKLHAVENEFLKFRLTLNNLTCTECDKSFPYFDMLKKHMIEHFGSFICDLCGACFLEQSSLRTHIKSHNRVEKNFPCDICGKNLKSKYSKMMHIATVHEKKATVNCYKCEAAFLSHALRNRHLIEVHGDKRTFPCKSCDKVYNRRKTLMEHNRRNHLKVYRHQCDLCDQRFYLPSRLKEHMATHTGERNFRCEFCDKSYPRLQSLQEHLRSHSTERRHKCVICNSTFTQNGSLKNHMKTHHQSYDVGVEYNG